MKSLFDSQIKLEILNRINNLSENKKPLWGKMNVNQMVCHCSDQLRMAMNVRQTKDVGSFITKKILKNLVFLGLKAPKGKVQTLVELNQHLKGTKPTNFSDDIKTLKNLLDEFCCKNEKFAWGIHGAFGKLTYEQWGKLAYLHLDHHLEQFGV